MIAEGSMEIFRRTERPPMTSAEPIVTLLDRRELAETKLPDAFTVVRLEDTKIFPEEIDVTLVVPDTLTAAELKFVLMRLFMLAVTAVIVLVEIAEATRLGVVTELLKLAVLEVRVTELRVEVTRRVLDVILVVLRLAILLFDETNRKPVLTLVADVVPSTLVPDTVREPMEACWITLELEERFVEMLFVVRRLGIVPDEVELIVGVLIVFVTFIFPMVTCEDTMDVLKSEPIVEVEQLTF